MPMTMADMPTPTEHFTPASPQQRHYGGNSGSPDDDANGELMVALSTVTGSNERIYPWKLIFKNVPLM